MIGNAVKEMLMKNQETFLIPGEEVAHVLDTHPLNHALLVLTKVNYTKIPVLNREDEIVGLIGLSEIVAAMFEVTEIEPANLDHQIVRDVMDTSFKKLHLPFDIEYILHVLVDHPFVPVVDQQEHFIGILTRKEILKSVNQLVHTIENEYVIEKKITKKLKIS